MMLSPHPLTLLSSVNKLSSPSYEDYDAIAKLPHALFCRVGLAMHPTVWTRTAWTGICERRNERSV